MSSCFLQQFEKTTKKQNSKAPPDGGALQLDIYNDLPCGCRRRFVKSAFMGGFSVQDPKQR